MTETGSPVRRATGEDAETIGRLLHDFNTEFEDVTPGPAKLAARIREVMAEGATVVLLAGPDGDEGLAVLRFRPSLWTENLECYLAELYVVPARRGQGFGRALLEAAMAAAEERDADYMDIGTSEDDVAARALYESAGFTNREGRPDGPIMYVYERELPRSADE